MAMQEELSIVVRMKADSTGIKTVEKEVQKVVDVTEKGTTEAGKNFSKMGSLEKGTDGFRTGSGHGAPWNSRRCVGYPIYGC